MPKNILKDKLLCYNEFVYKILLYIKKHKRISILLKTILVCVLLIFILYICIVSSYFYFENKWYQNEKSRIYNELITISGIKINSVDIFEHRSLAKIEVLGKGEIDILYDYNDRTSGNFKIKRIGKYETSFFCVNVGSNRTLNSEGHEDLSFEDGSRFKKWFPFEIKNPSDLVNHYDDVVKVLQNVPKGPSMTVVYESRRWSKNEFVDIVNPNFVSQTKINGLDVYCDLSSSKNEY